MPKISEDKIFEIRAAINIVHYISQFINLKKMGQNYKGLCPFHTEKTPSFVVSQEKQIYHCFGCGKGGNVYSFIMDYEKLPFTDALKKAADFAGVLLPKSEQSGEAHNYFQQLYMINETACSFFEQNLSRSANKEWMNYFLQRGLSPETIKSFRLGYAPDSFDMLLKQLRTKSVNLDEAAKLGIIQARDNRPGYYDKFRHRVIFPFVNLSGKIIGFGGRKLKEEQQPKYLNSPESPVYKKGEILYGLHQAIQAIREHDFVVLVEGYFDLLRLAESGLKNVVASSGTALTADQAKLMRRYTKNVHIAYDGDQAGIKAALRNAGIIESQDLNAFIVPMPAGDDPDTFVLSNGIGAFEKLIHSNLLPIEFQINQFLKSNKSPSVEDKERFIQEILENLAGLNNQVKVGLYLHQIADRLQINENMLIAQINRLKRFKKKTKNRQAETAPPADAPKKKVVIQTGTYKAEAGLICLLLNAAEDNRQYIIDNAYLELFENPDLIQLFEFIIQEIEETGKHDAGNLMQSYQDDEAMKQVISKITLIDYADENKFARDCIFQLKKWQLQKQSQELSTLIREDTGSADAVLHYNQELMQVRKEINALELARRKTL